MGRGDGPGKSDRIATIEALKGEEKGIMTMSNRLKRRERSDSYQQSIESQERVIKQTDESHTVD